MAKWLLVYFSCLVILAIFSYSFVDPNLTLISNQTFLTFQARLSNLRPSDQLMSVVYVGIISTLFGSYWQLTKSFFTQHQSVSTQKLVVVDKSNLRGKLQAYFLQHPLLKTLAIGLLPTLVVSWGYNAFSHDIFNYIFNSRMVMEYGANPHVTTALEFASDPWVRFMHNTHTPAPYGYGWTALSLVPAILGQSIFSLTWVLFKAWSVLGLALFITLAFYWKQARKESFSSTHLMAVFWNPLVVLEVGLNAHNDFWMLAPAAASLVLILISRKKSAAVVSLGLLLFSISIKLATVVLLPLWLILFQLPLIRDTFINRLKGSQLSERFMEALSFQVGKFVPLLASFLLFLPLLTARSKYFLPWYLLWSWAWLGLDTKGMNKWWIVLVSASLSSLYRYVPWLWHGGYVSGVETQQVLITWLGMLLLYQLLSNHSARHSKL